MEKIGSPAIDVKNKSRQFEGSRLVGVHKRKEYRASLSDRSELNSPRWEHHGNLSSNIIEELEVGSFIDYPWTVRFKMKKFCLLFFP
jgi:hypothetical protein